jgi:hypothetical protein
MLTDVGNWIVEMGKPGWVWFAKRLSGNDTLANGTHQAGPYIPKDFLFSVFPALNDRGKQNPDVWFEMCIDSYADCRDVRAIWYNNKFYGGTRDETRITQLGGSSSPLLDPDSTGALVLFAFWTGESGTTESCHVWVCRDETEADVLEEEIGPVEPGVGTVWKPGEAMQASIFAGRPATGIRGSCWLDAKEIPSSWLTTFPSGINIVEKAVAMRPESGVNVDRRLLNRRKCEYEVFLSVEEAVELPYIKQGFKNIGEFIAKAQTILQRRKARAGRSLELHVRAILLEEKFNEDRDFSYDCESEPNKRPDFLFPSQAAYKNPSYPSGKLRMLAAKTTCKDRWRQILNEADRIDVKHLLTLQEGVSENQFQEMTKSNVRLVVPQPLITSFPKSVQPHLQTLESFMGDARLLTA